MAKNLSPDQRDELVRAAYQFALEEITNDIDANGWDVPDFTTLHDFVDANEYLIAACDSVGVAICNSDDEDGFAFGTEVADWLDGALKTRYADAKAGN